MQRCTDERAATATCRGRSPARRAAATPKASERRPLHRGRAGQAAGDEPHRSDPDVVGPADAVAVVVGVVHADLQRETHEQGARDAPPDDVAGPHGTRGAERDGNDGRRQRARAGSDDPAMHECAMMGRMSELWQLGALELAGKIAAKQVSSREVVESHLARVHQVNQDVNAIVRLLTDDALAAADRADKAVANDEALGPLHGVPCSVKENIDVAGSPTTDGVPIFADAIAPCDSPTVERMRAAGAIPFARTNLPDFGLRVHTDSSFHGLTRNPWNPNVTAGGSSGGEASAIASGMSPIGLGNDIGGSLRNPAHCCGIASLKPTIGVVPMASAIPPQDKLLSSQLMLVEGPMARHVADVRAALGILAGQHWRDPRSVTAVLTDAAPGERLRIAVLTDPPGGQHRCRHRGLDPCGRRPTVGRRARCRRDHPARVRARDRALDRHPDRRPARPAGTVGAGHGPRRAGDHRRLRRPGPPRPSSPPRS